MVRYQAGQGKKLVIKKVASEKTLANSKFVKTTAIFASYTRTNGDRSCESSPHVQPVTSLAVVILPSAIIVQ